ncbi:hypothetical protein CHL76_16190 [Marinococcus halophilus]|uniref:5,10-methylene-tetrahydrofolate dehydrogenase n=1 Tax=Marinococcus halophilus TaxID=1371 RepID=A0A510YA44_MARHA|nr:hypothetical protein [Marinococcus halophilus]OZT78774.1 hypothetical protein CHL76_16190 [Marinococcus halophilus]GEK60230.1 hypothetical protein MHA01_31350 [Marinococcus halophilus]
MASKKNKHSSDSYTLGLIAAPELPKEICDEIEGELPDLLKNYVDDRRGWEVEVLLDPFAGVIEKSEPVIEEAKKHKEKHEWDYALCFTDLPIVDGKKLVIADASSDREIGLISLPSLGAMPMKKRVREAMMQLVNEMHHGSSEEDRERQNERIAENQEQLEEHEDDHSYQVRGRGSRELMGSRLYERFSPIKRKVYSNEEESQHVRFYANLNVRGRTRLLSGMVLANRPWTIFPAFKRVIALAFATGAYGLIFPSFWMLSDTYGFWRFLAVMFTAMVAMTVWFIVAHGLWENESKAESKFLVRSYNKATASTIGIAIIHYYIVLFIMFLIVSLLFIPASQLALNLSGTVTFATYLKISWLACTVATLGGALGAGLESEETVLKATYGYRQRIRNERAKSEKQKKNSS